MYVSSNKSKRGCRKGKRCCKSCASGGVTSLVHGLGGLGQDSNFGIPVDLTDFSAPVAPVVNYPASPSSGLVYSPGSSDAVETVPNDNIPLYTSDYTPTASSYSAPAGPATAQVTGGAIATIPTSWLGGQTWGISNWLILTGSVGMFFAFVGAMKRGR